MSDLPPGEWTGLLIGNQWPSAESVAVVTSAATRRATVETAFEGYADIIKSARTGPLAVQEGITADETRNCFQIGEAQARNISESNGVKRLAYETSHQSTNTLRSELSDIASHGNREIQQIQATKTPLAIKLGLIADVVLDAQARANVSAAAQSERIYAEVQKVLTASHLDISAREFARSHGIDLDRAYSSPSPGQVREQVRQLLDSSGASTNKVIGSTSSSETQQLTSGTGTTSPADGSISTTTQKLQTSEGSMADIPLSSAALDTSSMHTTARLTSSSSTAGTAQEPAGINSAISSPMPIRGVTAGSNTTASSGISGGQQVPVAGSSTQPASAAGSPGSASMPAVSPGGSSAPAIPSSALTPTTALSPDGLAQNFNAGTHPSAPMSVGTEALSSGAMHAMQPQAPLHAESTAPAPIASTAPTGGVHLFGTADAATTIDTPPTAPPSAAAQTIIATPTPAGTVMPSNAAAPSIAPGGPLPAYGADLRPAVASTPAGPAPTPSATPNSAPVNPANASSLSQPAVVRQQPTAAPTPSAAGATENAFVATATGAAARVASAQTRALQRLHRLLEAVARQEPKLRWAIGEREDGATVLTTDLASGWIPPHVEIPTGVTLLTPGHRRPVLSAMLGETTLTAEYTPGQYIPAADEEAAPVSMSIRSRQTTEVEELGWELGQATKWRDGLPRLAHTLAKAASKGTGYLDSEVDFLREHLATVTRQVLTDYPGTVDSLKVGNWQLLATIAALIKDERTSANYHLAWFQTLNSAVRGEQRR